MSIEIPVAVSCWPLNVVQLFYGRSSHADRSTIILLPRAVHTQVGIHRTVLCQRIRGRAGGVRILPTDTRSLTVRQSTVTTNSQNKTHPLSPPHTATAHYTVRPCSLPPKYIDVPQHVSPPNGLYVPRYHRRIPIRPSFFASICIHTLIDAVCVPAVPQRQGWYFVRSARTARRWSGINLSRPG